MKNNYKLYNQIFEFVNGIKIIVKKTDVATSSQEYRKDRAKWQIGCFQNLRINRQRNANVDASG
jgi:hypothetical protein